MTGPPPAVTGSIWSATAGPTDARHVVLVHGSLDRSAGLLKLSRRLDRRFLVSRYDRRGYGRSLTVGGPYGMEHQVADLVGVLRTASMPGLVVGHSFGGDVALAAAQRHPELVAGVVVYEAPLSWLDWWPRSTAGGDARAWRHDPGEAAERFMRRLIGDDRWDRLPSSTRSARRAEGPALVGELEALRERAPWEPAAIDAPVLAMCGERSSEHHRRSAEVIGEWFGRPPLVVPGARHFGPNTHPDDVAAAVVRFAEQVLGGRPPS